MTTTSPDFERPSSKAACVALTLMLVGGALVVGYALNQTRRYSSAPIGGLKAIHNAQILYREGDKDGDGTRNYAPSLQALINTGTTGEEDLIDEVLASGTKQGYVYAITSVSQSGWTANANPGEPGVTGDRYSGVNMNGQVFFSLKGPVRWNPDGTSPDPELGR